MTIAPLLFALIVATPGAGPETSRAPVLLDFHSQGCGPCRQMRPAIQQLIAKGYPIKSVDIEEDPRLAARYNVTAVPTFVVVDPSGRSLARIEGFRPAADLANLYLEAKAKTKAKAAPPAAAVDRDDDDDPRADADAEADPDDAAQPAAEAPEVATPEPTRTNPDPWKTVVRIKVQGNGSIGYGSGTIIYSDAEQSIILTCAHIFKLEGPQQATPSRFPRPIVVDLFDGRLGGNPPQQVHYLESVAGKAIDYDFDRDVGLIRITPGRKLESSRVVPPSWAPKSGMRMTTVGCSEGHDATAWSTAIVHPLIRGLTGSAAYEAIECRHAPKQGRSGGGLYTSDGYVAGVCDFAEPRGDHGLYATPKSIRAILDKNNLMALYAPVSRPGSGGPLLAKTSANPRRSPASSIARAQSPDADDTTRVTIPPPELLGIRPPTVAQAPPPARASGSRGSWHSVRSPAEATDLLMAPEADDGGFDPRPETGAAVGREPTKAPAPRRKGGWKAIRSEAATASSAP